MAVIYHQFALPIFVPFSSKHSVLSLLYLIHTSVLLQIYWVTLVSLEFLQRFVHGNPYCSSAQLSGARAVSSGLLLGQLLLSSRQSSEASAATRSAVVLQITNFQKDSFAFRRMSVLEKELLAMLKDSRHFGYRPFSWKPEAPEGIGS